MEGRPTAILFRAAFDFLLRERVRGSGLLEESELVTPDRTDCTDSRGIEVATPDRTDYWGSDLVNINKGR